MITVVTWLWGDKFKIDDVLRLRSAVARNLREDHRFLCLSDRPFEHDGIECCSIWNTELCKRPGCFARLRLFDPELQEYLMVDEKIVNMDLDTVITGQLDPLFNRPESFCIMQGGNASNPCPYNGALIMLRRGEHADVWRDFTVGRAAAVPYYAYPDDQGWIWHKIPNASGWKCGDTHGVYVYKKPGWHGGDALPPGARLVTFINNSPRSLRHLDWVQEHWR